MAEYIKSYMSWHIIRKALSDICGKKVSTVKNILDAVCVTITIAIGNYFLKDIIVKNSGLTKM